MIAIIFLRWARCLKLDGTQAGVRANAVATAGPLGSTKPNGYYFDTKAISNITATYATTFGGTYDSYATASSSATNSYRFIRVTVTQNLSLNFLPVLPGIPTTLSVSAGAIAGQQPQTDVTNEQFDAVRPGRSQRERHHEFRIHSRSEYLKWGNGNTGLPAAETQASTLSLAPDAHGLQISAKGTGPAESARQSSTEAFRTQRVLPRRSTPPKTYTRIRATAARRSLMLVAARSDQDLDQSDTTIAAYEASLKAGTANGRHRNRGLSSIRPLRDREWQQRPWIVIGFGNFLLDPGSTISAYRTYLCNLYRAREY